MADALIANFASEAPLQGMIMEQELARLHQAAMENAQNLTGGWTQKLLGITSHFTALASRYCVY